MYRVVEKEHNYLNTATAALEQMCFHSMGGRFQEEQTPVCHKSFNI